METDQLHILIIEETPDLIQLIRKMISFPNYHIMQIQSGMDALRYLTNKENTPDVILVNHKLPEMDGIELLRRVQQIRDDLSLIFVTSDDSIQTVTEAMRAGAMDFIIRSGNIENDLTGKFEKTDKIRISKNNALRIENELTRIAHLNRQLSTVVEQSSATVVITDLDGTIIYLNPQFEVISGYTREEAMGQNPRILKSDYLSKEYYAEMWRILKSGNNWIGEFNNIHKNGTRYWEESIITPIKNDKNEIVEFAAIKHDITKRKLAEEKIKLQNLELAKLNDDKNIFISILAHDLKNPFSTFMNLVKYIKENLHRLNAENLQQFIEIINDSAQNTYQLLIDLLNWARSESGNIPFNPQSINCNEMINSVTKLFELQSIKKGTAIINYSPDDRYMYADVDIMKTVLRNLISNALKFTNPGGNISINVIELTEEICLSVKDDGVGMDEESLSNLFSITKISTTPGTDNEQGSGFGLIVCKQFVAMHKGRIEVQSEEGKGTTFTIYIPRK